MKTKVLITDFVTFLLILLWGYAAISKWMEPRFIYQLTSSPLIGYNFGHVLYWLLPIGELVIALLLVFSRTRYVGLVLSASLMTLFTAYIIYILTFVPAIPCSCGGIISKLSWKEHLIFNALYLLINCIAVRVHRQLRNKTRNELTAYFEQPTS